MDLKKNRWQPWLTALIFCILIFGFTVVTLIKSPLEFSETENRVLAQKPEINPEAVMNGKFGAEYEEYLTDQFVFRDDWIGLKTSVEKLLLKRESKDIYFAEDGYFIEKHTGCFTTDMARRNITALTQFTEKYNEQFGTGHMTIMVIPNAVDILQDKLPPFAGPGGGMKYLEELAKALPEDVWFDAASILNQHRDEELFYRTDHHWKTLAAFYVYHAWV